MRNLRKTASNLHKKSSAMDKKAMLRAFTIAGERPIVEAIEWSPLINWYSTVILER